MYIHEKQFQRSNALRLLALGRPHWLTIGFRQAKSEKRSLLVAPGGGVVAGCQEAYRRAARATQLQGQRGASDSSVDNFVRRSTLLSWITLDNLSDRMRNVTPTALRSIGNFQTAFKGGGFCSCAEYRGPRPETRGLGRPSQQTSIVGRRVSRKHCKAM